MKIMVTGGAGFIGSNVVDGYIQAGHRVIVVDDLSTGRRDNINPEAHFYQVDIRSGEMDGIMGRERPEILNHHAAQASVPLSVSDPILDADINIKGLLNLLERAVRYGVRKVIFISSGGAIYGEASEYPTSEDYLPRPLSPYAISKLASEYYLAYYSHQYGIDYTVLRYANIYGPRQVAHGEAGVVAIFMSNILAGKSSILNHFPENPEGMIRDYCYVGDVVKSNVKALEGGSRVSINVGTGRETKTLELYSILYNAVREYRPDLSDALAEPLRKEARPGDIKRSCLIVDKAQTALGWVPETSLEKGIPLTLRWWIEHVE